MTDRGQQQIAPDGPAGKESRTAPHPTSIAVWGVPSPVVVDGRFAVQVGVKCATGCALAGQPVVVRDEAGADIGHGRLDDRPEPGTNALYAAEVTLEAPAEEGVHAWTAVFDGAEPDPAHESNPGPEASPGHEAPSGSGRPQQAVAHATATAAFSFRAVSPPEHRVTVRVVDRDAETPLCGAEVRVGVYRGTTDASGQAQVEVQAGSYQLYVRKVGYGPHTDSVEVSGDVALRVAAAPVSEVDPDDEQVWM